MTNTITLQLTKTQLLAIIDAVDISNKLLALHPDDTPEPKRDVFLDELKSIIALFDEVDGGYDG